MSLFLWTAFVDSNTQSLRTENRKEAKCTKTQKSQKCISTSNFRQWLRYSRGVRGTEVTQWVPGAKVWGLETKSPGSEAICGHCLEILTAETMKIWKKIGTTCLVLDQRVSITLRAERHIGVLAVYSQWLAHFTVGINCVTFT